MENAITSLQDLRKWFESKETPYYTLYIGRGTNQNMVLHRQRNEMSPQEAWMQIENDVKISSYGGGVFTLVTREDVKKENILNGKVYVAINTADNPQHRMNGINSPQIGQDAINKAVTDALEVYDLKRKVEELENEIEAVQNQSFFERIGNRLSEHPELPQLCEAILMRFLGPSVQQPGATTIHGMPKQSGTIEESIERIQKVFPDPTAFIHGLSSWVEKHPEMAKQIFEEQILMHNEQGDN